MSDNTIARRATLLTGIGLALFLPLFTVVLPAAGLDGSAFDDPGKLDAFVRHHFALFALPYLDGLLLHLAGLVVVLAFYRLFSRQSEWALPAAIGGAAWMILDTAQNGVVLYSTHEVVRHAASSVSGPQLVLINQMTTGLRLAGHVLGGFWVLVTSGLLVQRRLVSPWLGRLGLLAGALMALNVLAPPTQFPLFVLLPVWFVGLAIASPWASGEATAIGSGDTARATLDA